MRQLTCDGSPKIGIFVSNMGLYPARRCVIMTTMPASGVQPALSLYDCVLIDDDEIIRATWALAAKKTGRRLLTLGTFATFGEHESQLDRAIPIYVDYSLNHQSDGTSIIEQLLTAGFTHLYIETGYDAADVDRRTRSLLKDVVGKAPPWEVRRHDSQQAGAKDSRS